MDIALHDNEFKNNYPNLALMKISAYYKSKGDNVEWFNPIKKYDKIYSSKVFTFTKEDPYLPNNSIKGGTGYNNNIKLPEEIDLICPDYTIYNCNVSYGFLTRGCPNKCSWCFVPSKEGDIKAYQDIEDFARHKEVILMDNNVLASSHGIKQIEKIIDLKLKVDFNQGLDARLIDNSMAKLLSKVKWLKPLRLACDSKHQIDYIYKAVNNLRYNNCTPSKYFVYVLVKDIDDALERIKFLKGLYLDPFAQPYRDKEGNEPTKEQKAFARWVNMKAVYKKTTWEDYKYNKVK